MGHNNSTSTDRPAKSSGGLKWRADNDTAQPDQTGDPLLPRSRVGSPADAQPSSPDKVPGGRNLSPIAVKEWLIDFWDRHRLRIILAVVVPVALLLIINWAIGLFSSSGDQIDPAAEIPIQPLDAPGGGGGGAGGGGAGVGTAGGASAGAGGGTDSSQYIIVHIAGEVTDPGVYRLNPDARVFDLIAKAGGVTTSADTDSINLAQVLTDGTRVCIPRKGDPASCALTSNISGGSGGPGGSGGSASSGETANLRINPNTASTTQLQRLPGIGPSLAAAIDAYRREGGYFSTPEDLLDVSGIGPETLKGFADLLAF